jgi:hypothetical protein
VSSGANSSQLRCDPPSPCTRMKVGPSARPPKST